jgi:serine/threonine-protein kinase
MRPNPYTHLGQPIRTFEHFYGRKRELAKVADDVRNGQCISVVGIRRIGKTSLLFQLLDSQARDTYALPKAMLCIYITCERMIRMKPGEIYAEIMYRVARQLMRDERAGLVERPGETLSYRDFEDAILDLRDAGLRLTLLLDEFEILAGNQNLDVDFFLGLRALHTEYALTYVTASLHPLMDLPFSQEEVLSSPFPNIFDSVRLGLFTKAEAQALVRMAGVFSTETEEFLLDLTGGHPLALQHACYFAFARWQELEMPLTRDDHFVVWNRTQKVMEDQYRAYWKHLSLDQKRVLVAPTHFASQIASDTPVANLFKDLVTMGLLVKRFDGSFTYAGRALAEFVRLESNRDRSLRASLASGLVGQTLGQYQILDRLGRGGMADVYKGYQPSLDRDVAIKVMLPHVASDEGFSARFQREAQAVAALRHAHIIQIYDFGRENGIYYMVMEYIPGQNLRDYLREIYKRGKWMPMETAMRILRQIGEALHYAHEQGLLHRDVKPANVMLTSSPSDSGSAGASSAILTDFGLAKIVGGTRLTGSNIIGTPVYMAPEQIIASSTVDHRVDVYALGVMFYEMLTGQLPFNADTPAGVVNQHLHQPLPNPRDFRPDVPVHIVNVIKKALAKDVSERYQTVQAMLRDCESDDTSRTRPGSPGIPADLHERLQTTLLKCGPFGSHRELQAVFVDTRIARWRHGLPQATDEISRVNQVVSFLLDKEEDVYDLDSERDSRNALVLFLRVLSDRAASGDACHRELSALAHTLAQRFRCPA